MNKKLDLRNRRTLTLVILSIVLTMVITFTATLYIKSNNFRLLKGQAAETKKSDQICGVDDSKNFVVVSGSIIQNFGDRGPAKITFTSGNKSYSKELTIGSGSYTNFSYKLPKGSYDMTITKDGFNTYENKINEESNLKITLFNSKYSDIIESNHLYYNVYYDYYKDGTLHIRTDGTPGGDFSPSYDNVLATDISKTSVLGNIVERQLAKNGVSPDFSSSSSGSVDLSELFHVVWNLLYSNVIGSNNSGDLLNIGGDIRVKLLQYREMLENGQCMGEDAGTSPCNDANVYGLWHTADDAITAVDCILSIPMNTKVIIDDDVSVLVDHSLSSVVSEELTIPASVKNIGVAEFMLSSIGTLNFNASVDEIPASLLANSKVGSVNLKEDIKSIGESAFANSSLNSIVLPNEIISIGSSAFENNNLTEIILPGTLTSIGSSAFSENKLKEIILPGTLTSIGFSAFSDNPLTSITVHELTDSEGNVINSKTRFNKAWTNYGFPSELMPTSN